MISSVRGHVIDQVASVADIAQPASGWSGAAFHSGFTFDFAREGAVLRRILRSLDHGAVIESSDTGPTTGLRHTESVDGPDVAAGSALGIVTGTTTRLVVRRSGWVKAWRNAKEHDPGRAGA